MHSIAGTDHYLRRIFHQSKLIGWSADINVGVRQINNLRFADNVALCTQTEAEMKEVLEKVKTWCGGQRK